MLMVGWRSLSVLCHLVLSIRPLITWQVDSERDGTRCNTEVLAFFCNLGAAHTHEQGFFTSMTPRRQGFLGAILEAAYHNEKKTFVKQLRIWG